MDPTTYQQPPTAVSSSQPLRCSLLAGSIDWSPHSISFGWQQDVPHRMPWIRQNPRIVKFTDVRRSRCRSASLAFKRHLESRDQEPSSKHFLSEDKMAARFNSLSLDNDHIYGSNGFPIQGEDPKWQEAYTRLKELQQRLSQDGGNDNTNSSEEENELNNVIVDGEFFMADCPLLKYSSHAEECLYRSCAMEPPQHLTPAHHPGFDGSTFLGPFYTASTETGGNTRGNGNMNIHPVLLLLALQLACYI